MKGLYVKRVATVYSLNQLDDVVGQVVKGVLASPDKMVGESAAGGYLPRLVCPAAEAPTLGRRVNSFQDLGLVPDMDDMNDGWAPSSSPDSNGVAPIMLDADSTLLDGVVPQSGLMDTVLLAEWEDRFEMGLFRYDVTACATKAVPGKTGFIAQLNEGRGSKKRPTEFCVDQVNQPFDEAKFNFKKALQKEVLFQFEPRAEAARTSFEPRAAVPSSANMVFINVSPIEYGHVLLVPRVLDNLNQLVAPDTMLLALQFAREANNVFFRLGYNSLGAYGTVNHLHFQAYYLSAPFAVELAKTEPIGMFGSQAGVSVSRLVGYPVRALVFEAGASLPELADLVGGICQKLQAANVPHNLFIADCGMRVFLYPNRFAEGKARGTVPEDVMRTQVDPAVFEISGHMLFKFAADYEAATEKLVWRILAEASWGEAEFECLVEMMLGGKAKKLPGLSRVRAMDI